MVLTEIRERIGYIILNRLDKKNAFNPEMIQEIQSAFDAFREDDQVKVVVLSSNSDVFCAGADLDYLKSLQTNSYNENLADSMAVKDMFEQIYTFPKITIAQIEGHAIAGGAGLANACDFCFAVPDIKMGYTEVKIGFTPAIVSVFLIRKIGEMKARELLLTGNLISALEAKKMNLINEIYSTEEIKEKVFDFAKNIAKTTSSESIKHTKELIGLLHDKSLQEGMILGAQFNAKMRETEDFKKGVSSFINKEKIDW